MIQVITQYSIIEDNKLLTEKVIMPYAIQTLELITEEIIE